MLWSVRRADVPRPRLQFIATSWSIVTLDYLYERELADGRHEPQLQDDISYRQHFASLGTLLQPTDPISLELTYVFRYKQFTTDLIGDSLRGDADTLHQGTAQLHYDLLAAARITLGFQRTQRSSTVSLRDFFNTNTLSGLL